PAPPPPRPHASPRDGPPPSPPPPPPPPPRPPPPAAPRNLLPAHPLPPQPPYLRVRDHPSSLEEKVSLARQIDGQRTGKSNCRRPANLIVVDHPSVEELVRPFVVVRGPKGVEGALLRGEGGARRSDGVRFECLVHPFMGSVLLRMRGQDPLMLNAEAQPPHVQLRQPVQAGRGERHAVVGADRAGETAFTEQAFEDGPHAWSLR